MHRTDLQRISAEKLADAELLLRHGRYANAYYLAGYAVEIGLKACIARQITADRIPDKRFILSIFDHNVTKLVGVAGLDVELSAARRAQAAFDANWGAVSQWHPECRYAIMGLDDAELLVSAVADNDHGVLSWIKAYW